MRNVNSLSNKIAGNKVGSASSEMLRLENSWAGSTFQDSWDYETSARLTEATDMQS